MVKINSILNNKIFKWHNWGKIVGLKNNCFGLRYTHYELYFRKTKAITHLHYINND